MPCSAQDFIFFACILPVVDTIANCCLPVYSPIGQWVVSPTADPGDASSIPAQSHTFDEIDHKIISTVILTLQLIQEGLLSV